MSVNITTVRTEIKKVVDPVKTSLAALVTNVSGVRSSVTALATRVGQVEGRVDQHDKDLGLAGEQAEESLAKSIEIEQRVMLLEADHNVLRAKVEQQKVHFAGLHAAHAQAINALGESVTELGELVEELLDGDEDPPAPEPWPFASIQEAVDAAAPGDVVLVPASVWTETVTLNKAIVLKGQPGALITGGETREYGVIITASGAILDGFEVCWTATPRQRGMVQVEGALDVIVRNCRLHHSQGACLSIIEGRAAVQHCDIYASAYLGVHGWHAHGSTFEGCRIHDHQAAPDTHGWEHGGLKMSQTRDLTVIGCEIDHNAGPGLWADIYCENWLIQGNNIHHNAGPGLFYEVSRGAVVRGNRIWQCGHGSPGWNEGAAVRLANAADCLIEQNIVAWCADGMTVSQQNRTDWPLRQHVTGNLIRDNLVALANPRGEHNTFGIAFVWDTQNGQRGWSHSGNRVYHAHAPGPWGFGGPEGWWENSAAGFAQFEPSGVWLDVNVLTAELVAAGLPVHWE